MSIDVESSRVGMSSEALVSVSTVDTAVEGCADLSVSSKKKEYSIVGDALYATVSSDDAPTWLTDIISVVLGNSLNTALGSLSDTRTDLINALSGMHVAKNEFIEAINVQADEFGILTSRLESQNASLVSGLADVSSDISELRTTSVTPTQASAIAADQLTAAINTPGHVLNGAVTSISTVVTSVNDLGDAVGGFFGALDTLEGDLNISIAQQISAVEAQAGVDLRDYTDANFVNKTSYGRDIATIQAQIDKSITTWFDDGEPTLTSTPAVDWQDDAAKDVHLGDIYYDNMSGYAYRFKKVGSAYSWSKISDQDITAALTAAAAAQDTADGKRRVFYATPVPPYDQGDLWDTGNGLKRSGVDVLAGAPFDLAHWLNVADGYGSAADAEQAAKDYADQTFVDVTSYGQDIAQIQNQLDKSITTWFEEGEPKLNNAPASSWSTGTDKDVHVGDMYYDSLTGYAYRFQKSGSVYSWGKITDSDVTAALTAAANAQDTADGKRRVFFDTPVVPYDKGDLWDTGSGLKRSNADVAAGGSYSESHWVAVADVTDYEAAEAAALLRAQAAEKAAVDYADRTFVDKTSYGEDIEKLQAQLDQSITTWFMTGVPTAATLPASEWDTPEKKALHEGDLYYDDTPGFSYRYKMLSPDSYGWVVIEDEAVITALGAASGAQDTADSKRRVFFTPVDSLPPPPYDEGDLWDTGGGLKRADVAKAKDSTPSADDWVDVTDGAGAAEAAEQAAKNYADQTFVDVISYGQDIAQIQTQIDKSITTWFEDDVPTLSNAPASSWETDTDKDVHLGDLYYDNLTGYSYRFKKNGSIYSWNKISDSDVTAALAAAATAQDTADGKRRVFYATPIAPYDKGDLWDTGSGLKRANIDVAADGSYSPSHWVDVADGAGAAEAAEQAAKDYADLTFVDNVSYGIDKQQIQEQLDGSITTWFMPGVPLPAETTLPASDWTTTALKDLHIDDLYYDDDTGFVYRYKNVGGTYSWYRIVDQDVIDALDAASNAQDTADSKRRVFFGSQRPAPPYDAGDLWDTGAGLARALTPRGAGHSTFPYDWAPIADKHGAASAVYAKTEQTMTSFAALDSAGNPIVSAKFGVNLTTAIDGSVLIGGFDFDNDGTKVTAAFNVDEFKVGRADASGVSPFELIGQEVFIKDAFINTLDLKKLRLDGADVISTVGGVSKIKADYLEVEDVDISGLLSVENSVVGETIQSSNFSDVVGREAGWKLTRDGSLVAQDAVVRGDVEASSIKADSANIINTIHLAGNAVRIAEVTQIDIRKTVYDSTNKRILIADHELNFTGSDVRTAALLLNFQVSLAYTVSTKFDSDELAQVSLVTYLNDTVVNNTVGNSAYANGGEDQDLDYATSRADLHRSMKTGVNGSSNRVRVYAVIHPRAAVTNGYQTGTLTASGSIVFDGAK